MRTFIENYLHFMKNCIRPHYEKLKSLKSGFIENSIFENNRDPCLSFLHSCDLVHTQISSHAVMIIGDRQIAKLAQFERVVRSGVKFRPQRRLAWDQNLPWAAPELVGGRIREVMS